MKKYYYFTLWTNGQDIIQAVFSPVSMMFGVSTDWDRGADYCSVDLELYLGPLSLGFSFTVDAPWDGPDAVA